ncbi:MAG: cob(I)yrinic acid a,c-diamide adenosyltransferase [Planctomycetes bacterium]|nr:cob(I)yrinic acid a,c-diamide adenosyltransferase [Planctomycetota bacterium]
MSIATRTGDDGNTGLFGGRRVAKDDLRIEAYGSVDELNACIGDVRALRPDADTDALLERIQSELFALGAELATPRENNPAAARVQPFSNANLDALDADLRRIEDSLPCLTNFILPGGSALAARLHFARTICRRVERNVVTLARSERIAATVVRYLNRLSDFLFLLARHANVSSGVAEITWRQRGDSSAD